MSQIVWGASNKLPWLWLDCISSCPTNGIPRFPATVRWTYWYPSDISAVHAVFSCSITSPMSFCAFKALPACHGGQKASIALFQFENLEPLWPGLLVLVCSAFMFRRHEKQNLEFLDTYYSIHLNCTKQLFWNSLCCAPNWLRGCCGRCTCFGPLSGVPKSVV